MCSPAALIARASSLFFSAPHCVGLCPKETSIHIQEEFVHGHSGGVYLVPFRTQKSRPPASFPVLWYESPRERESLCLLLLFSDSSRSCIGWSPSLPPQSFSLGRKAIFFNSPAVWLRQLGSAPRLREEYYGAEVC